ncbi:[acyl-carrier-protein] S-malonyltransferase [Sediminihabitans luteus]|uniref:[acyl-carrier-protein] S-malonyltransferase n=1 Tax=Sediminihabitans luteus TaxID=1138585 RepID=A0A2M9CPY4_9CELL|nr:ACP S-malonyltransferase [Sediminihabitans luteus]PJJ73980.1 [acyl-carrier-protein] S-malonyltransferase [Sediminihabitans luteus]GII98107.1 ACP S-malonyltransferase [Sediminihabitans luteus]
MLAVVCPGQGSQSPAMFAPWLELPGVPDQLARLSQAAEIDLVAHGTTSDADTIRDTAVAQPLLVAASLVAAAQLFGDRPAADVVDVTAGHSVGELAAASVAGVFDDAGAVALVSHRARAMAQAAAAAESGMAAVVGGDPAEVLAAIEAAGLWPANVNGGGQVVAAGAHDGLARLAEDPPARARVIPLQVAGAFHTPFMDSARDAFTPVATGWAATDPSVTLLSNADGASYATIAGDASPHGRGADVLARLAAQVVAPVRWDLCQETLLELGVTGLVELAPGGVLTGLARRTLKGVETVAIKTPDDLEAARDLVARHSGVRPEADA